MKPTRHAISYVIYADNGEDFLVVQRPADDENLPDAWGLPAGTLREGETYEDAIIRSGKEKLGISLKVGSMLGEGETERSTYVLHMKEYEATIDSGEPEVGQPYPDVTQYQAWKWGNADDLTAAAGKGSLCCKIFLEHHNK